MKIIDNEYGYTTSIIILLMLLPLTMLMIIAIEEYSSDVDKSIETLETEKIQSKTEDFENEIITITKKSLQEVTLEAVTSQKSLTDSRTYLKKYIESKLVKKEDEYKKDNILIDTEIISIDSSNNPFKIELKYHITSRINNSNTKISKDESKLIDITDKNYPIYDPLSTLKTGATFKNNKLYFEDKLTRYLNSENSEAYLNTVTSITIRQCPYDDYHSHGNSNLTILNCIKNHYYHNSHDGMCLLCRLENKSSCNHYGFETFIIPTLEYDKAPVSIDHVLLNNKNACYDGNKITIDNMTILYLDNGHKTKYDL